MPSPLEIHIPLRIVEDPVIKLKVSEGGGGPVYPVYHGPTVVTPKVRESTELETRNKVVQANIVVEEIPYFETSNPKGLTFIIGGN